MSGWLGRVLAALGIKIAGTFILHEGAKLRKSISLGEEEWMGLGSVRRAWPGRYQVRRGRGILCLLGASTLHVRHGETSSLLFERSNIRNMRGSCVWDRQHSLEPAERAFLPL